MKQYRFHRVTGAPGLIARQKGFLSSKQAIVLLVLIFLAPTFVAWVMHNTGDGDWQPEGTTNRGVLVHPARPLKLSQDLARDGQPVTEYLQGKWTLIYIGNSDCDDVCKNNLYKMRQVRTAQNENMRRVQQLFVVSSGKIGEDLAGFLQSEHPQLDTLLLTPVQFEQLAGFFSTDGTSVQDAGRVYIVDPLGNLMMYYQPDSDASGMLKDLKKLLKFSRIG
jgi:cytochrome oxidase Cu insertion factor (SCO1/SenC/PrrC family)